jgi:hypothetical protein
VSASVSVILAFGEVGNEMIDQLNNDAWEFEDNGELHGYGMQALFLSIPNNYIHIIV